MTDTLSITVQTRTTQGRDVRKLRREGFLPGVIYGNNAVGVLIQIPYNDFVRLYREAGRTRVIDVSVEGKTYHCLVQDIDVDPVQDTARHVDFLSVNMNKKVVVSVPLEFVGISDAVVAGGVLNENLKEVEVEALPSKVPESIQVDISKLVTMQDNIYVSELPSSKDYTFVTEADVVVASVVEPQAEEPQTAETAEAGVSAEAQTTENTKTE